MLVCTRHTGIADSVAADDLRGLARPDTRVALRAPFASGVAGALIPTAGASRRSIH
jgi:hypothetical protein